MSINGIRKNMDKLRLDIRYLRNRPDGYVMDWVKQPWNMHHWVDIFVETARAAPYLMGHLWAVYVPASFITIVVLLNS
ncbi:MAG: hypothetical protein ACI9DH_000568 [Halioglobus sp.]|jgi:hypothetical protein